MVVKVNDAETEQMWCIQAEISVKRTSTTAPKKSTFVFMLPATTFSTVANRAAGKPETPCDHGDWAGYVKERGLMRNYPSVPQIERK